MPLLNINPISFTIISTKNLTTTKIQQAGMKRGRGGSARATNMEKTQLLARLLTTRFHFFLPKTVLMPRLVERLVIREGLENLSHGKIPLRGYPPPVRA